MLTRSSWQEFDTAQFPTPLRKARWAEAGSDTLSDMVVMPAEDTDFHARMKRIEIGTFGLVFIDTTPALATSSSCRIGQWAAPDQDALVLTVADRGHSQMSQGNWTVELAENDIVVRDLTRPWKSQSFNETGLILVKVPFSAVTRKVRDPASIVGRHLSGSHASVGLAVSIIRACRQALLAEPQGDWHQLMEDVLSDVFRLVCEGNSREIIAIGAAGRSIKRDAVTFIMRHLFEPELTVQIVADQIGVSIRHLQRAFITDGVSPRQFIVNARLDEAARQIVMATDKGTNRITNIALDVGFNDISHFSRTFSRRFGCAPSQYRRN